MLYILHSLGSIRKEVREIDGIEITSDLDTGDKLTHPRGCDQHLEYGQFILPTDGSGRPTDTSEASLIKTKIYELLFADDAGILTTIAESLQYLLQVYDKYFKMFGLELAIKKTEVMHSDHRQITEIMNWSLHHHFKSGFQTKMVNYDY